jgi:hypothetical protein
VLVTITSTNNKKAVLGEKPNLATAISTTSIATANQINGRNSNKPINNSSETGKYIMEMGK